jgi:hypothetical protein
MKLATWLCLLCALAAYGCGGADKPASESDAGKAGSSGAGGHHAGDEDDAGAHDAGALTKPPASHVCSVDGFCWELPSPQGETLRAAWAAASDDVWAVGDGGVALHYDGSGFRAEHLGVQQNLLAIHGSSASDVWAVGQGGAVLHFDGQTWSTQDLSALVDASGGAKTEAMYGVFAAAPDAVWAVGYSGVGPVIVHYDGQQWSNQSLGLQTDQVLRAVWGTARDHVWAVGDAGVVRSFDGTQWNVDKSATGAALTSVHALAAHDVWAVGANGTAIHWNGTTWSNANMGLSGALLSVRVDIAAPAPVMDAGMAGMAAPAPPPPVAGAGADAGLPKPPEGPWSVWAFGDKGAVFRYNGTLWAQLPSGTDLALYGATRVAAGTLISVGERGQMTRFEGDARQSLSVGSRRNHLALWGDGQTLWAVGDDIERRDTTGWNPLANPTGRSLYSVWGDTTGFWAVGTAGSIVHYKEGALHSVDVTAAGESWLHGVWGAGSSVWIVGDAGLALVSAAGSFIKVAMPVKSNLLDVWGMADDLFWAVGDGGVVLRWDGMAWLKVPTGPMGGIVQNLRAVWGTAKDDVWVVGTQGTILHWTGERFEMGAPAASYSLNDVWGRAKDDVYAVGSGGVALHYDGAKWTTLQTGTSRSLQSVFGDAHGHIFAAGLDGVVLILER